MSENKQFSFTLKNTRQKAYRLMAYGLIMVQFIALLAVALRSITAYDRTVGAVSSILVLLLVLTPSIIRKPILLNKTTDIALLVSCLAWLLLSQWIFAAASAILVALFVISQRKLVISFREEAVHYPSFPIQQYDWRSFSNIVLKDGLLTVEFRNNKFMQSEVIEQTSLLTEELFNKFCASKMNAASTQ